MATKFIRFFDDGKFIRAENAQTGVVAYINKHNLLIQRDSNLSFFLKNDTYVGYYLFTDIEYPITTEIDLLVDILKYWVQNDNYKDVTKGGDMLLEFHTTYNKNRMQIDELITPGGTSQHDPSMYMVNLTVNNQQADTRVVRQSRSYVNSAVAMPLVAFIQGTLIQDITSQAVTTRIGLFDNVNDITVQDSMRGLNGIFFQFDEEGVSLVLRLTSNGTYVDAKYLQSTWNLDKLDGNGASDFILDVTVPNTYVFEWDESSCTIKGGVYVEDKVIYCHRIQIPQVTYLHAPVRWEISTHDGGSGETCAMYQGKVSVFCKHHLQKNGNGFAKDTPIPKTLNIQASTIAIFTIRLQTQYNRAKLQLKKIKLVNTQAAGAIKWELVLNSTLDTPMFDIIHEDSLAEFSHQETTSTGGIVLSSGYMYDSGTLDIPIGTQIPLLLANIQGVQDQVTLRITNLQGTSVIHAGVEWTEYE